MAKKAKKTEVETTPLVVEQPKVETPVVEIPKPKKNKWEIYWNIWNYRLFFISSPKESKCVGGWRHNHN